MNVLQLHAVPLHITDAGEMVRVGWCSHGLMIGVGAVGMSVV